MPLKAILFATIALSVGGCGGSQGPAERATVQREPAQPRETVFDPLTSTIGRAEGVQQTLDAQAAEQRRRLEAAER